MVSPLDLLNPRGRMRRREAWAGGLLLAGLAVVLVWGLVGVTDGRSTSLVATLVLAWPVTVVMAKRLHDRGKTAWPWLLLYLGPTLLLTVLQQLEIGYVWRGGIAYPMSFGRVVFPNNILPNLLSFGALLTGLVGAFETAFLPGENGPNEYGPDPRVFRHE